MATFEDLKKPLAEIAPFGDVIFLVGPEAVKLRIVSTFLRTHSKVFEAMLGPSFSEDQNLTFHKPKEIDLPKDDAGALWIMFSVMHGRIYGVPDPLDPGMILRVSWMADKYDCGVSLKYPPTSWLQDDSSMEDHQRWQLMAAAYYFNNDKGFADKTRHFIYNFQGSYLDFTGVTAFLDSVVLLKFWVTLQEERERKRVTFLDSLMEELMDFSICCYCRAPAGDNGTNYETQRCRRQSIVERESTELHGNVVVASMNAIDVAHVHMTGNVMNKLERSVLWQLKLMSRLRVFLVGIEKDSAVGA